MREHPVPCRYATRYEREHLQHVTWNDDGECNPCKRNIERWNMKQIFNEEAEAE